MSNQAYTFESVQHALTVLNKNFTNLQNKVKSISDAQGALLDDDKYSTFKTNYGKLVHSAEWWSDNTHNTCTACLNDVCNLDMNLILFCHDASCGVSGGCEDDPTLSYFFDTYKVLVGAHLLGDFIQNMVDFYNEIKAHTDLISTSSQSHLDQAFNLSKYDGSSLLTLLTDYPANLADPSKNPTFSKIKKFRDGAVSPFLPLTTDNALFGDILKTDWLTPASGDDTLIGNQEVI